MYKSSTIIIYVAILVVLLIQTAPAFYAAAIRCSFKFTTSPTRVPGMTCTTGEGSNFAPFVFLTTF